MNSRNFSPRYPLSKLFHYLDLYSEIIPLRDGWKYRCPQDLVKHEGKFFKNEKLNDEEKNIVFAAIDNARIAFKEKQCFYNSQMLVLHDKSDSLIYNEGYAKTRINLPIHHGWASLNGKVVDLTWCVKNPRTKGRLHDRILGEFPEDYEYLGIPFPQKNLIRLLMLRRGWAGTLIDDWRQQWPLVRGESFENAYKE